MYDKCDFVHKSYNGKRLKLYRIICDVCGEKQGYGSLAHKKNYCKKCQYKKLSDAFSNRVRVQCFECGKVIYRVPSQLNRASVYFCSVTCHGKYRRKDITEVARNQLKNKLIQLGIEPKCTRCGHDHEWNLQVHHKVFVSKGGSNELSNLEFLCRNCHADVHIEKGRDDDE